MRTGRKALALLHRVLQIGLGRQVHRADDTTGAPTADSHMRSFGPVSGQYLLR
jgi:hypothetical protein